MGVGSLGHPSLGIFLSLVEPPCPQMSEDEPPLRNSHWLTEQILRHSPVHYGFTVVQLVLWVLA